MQNSLFQAICRMGIFMICAQAVIHFRPKEVYEKYLKLLVSVMVLIQVFLPIGGILLGKGGQDAADRLEQFRKDLEQNMQEAYERGAQSDAMLEQMTLEEIRNRLEAQQAEEQGEARESGSGQEEAGKSGSEQENGLQEEAQGQNSESSGNREENPENSREPGGGMPEEEPGSDSRQTAPEEAQGQELQETDGAIKIDLDGIEPISIEPLQ